MGRSWVGSSNEGCAQWYGLISTTLDRCWNGSMCHALVQFQIPLYDGVEMGREFGISFHAQRRPFRKWPMQDWSGDGTVGCTSRRRACPHKTDSCEVGFEVGLVA